MQYHSYFLQNGARVLLVPQKDVKSATVLIMYPVGSRYESESLQGVSHYIEHMMFKGTVKRKNTLILTREIDRLGAEYNAFTSKEYTGYYIKTESGYLNVSLDILSDMLFHSVFDPAEMEREKGPIVEELKMYRDNPVMNIDNIFESLLYTSSPLGRDIGGTDRHVLGYKRPDVLQYRDRYYDVSNMTIVVAGAMPENVQEMIQKFFGTQKKKKTAHTTFKSYQFGSVAKKERVHVLSKQTDQAQMMLGFPGFNYTTKQNVPLAVLNTILGGSFSSRLFIRIRERLGLAYVIRSGQENFRDTGYSFVRAGLDAKNLNKAIAAILNEITKIVKSGPTKQELADAKTHIRGGLMLSLEDSSAQANWYAKEALFYASVQTPEDYLKRIDMVHSEDIGKVAKQVFDMKKLRIAVIGDVKAETIRF